MLQQFEVVLFETRKRHTKNILRGSEETRVVSKQHRTVENVEPHNHSKTRTTMSASAITTKFG